MPKSSQPPTVELDSDKTGVAAVDRALATLRAFQKGDDALTLAELAKRTQLYKSTLLRLLVSLERALLIRRHEDGRYSLGPEVARLHGIYADAFSEREVVMGVLKELVEQTGESAAYYVRQGDLRLCLYRVDSPHLLRDQTREGDLLPLDRGSGGRLVLAFTGGVGPVYAKIRKEQLVITKGELLPELSGITAPVFRANGEFAGAMNLSIPTYRFTASHAKHVQDAAVRLTTLFGGSYPSSQAKPGRAS